MRAAGFVADFVQARVVGDAGQSLHLMFEDPTKLPVGFWSTPPQLRLPVAAAAGAGPGLVAGDVALRRWQATQPVDWQGPMERITRYDSGGRPLPDAGTPMEQVARFDRAGNPVAVQ